MRGIIVLPFGLHCAFLKKISFNFLHLLFLARLLRRMLYRQCTDWKAEAEQVHVAL